MDCETLYLTIHRQLVKQANTLSWGLVMRSSVVTTVLLILEFVSQLNAQTVEWERTYGGSGEELANSLKQTSDGGFIILGNTSSFGPNSSISAWLIKTDALGDTFWTNTFGDSGGQQYGKSVQQTDDGGYVFTGSTLPYDETYADVLLIKTDSLGNTTWINTIGGNGWDEGNGVHQTNDGGYIITGSTDPTLLDIDILLIKTDASG